MQHALQSIDCSTGGAANASTYRPGEQKRLQWCMWITGAFMVVEFLGGLWTGSLALLSDAGHMFSHLFSLFISFGAILIASRAPDEVRSYGFYRAEILAALFNGVTLAVIVLFIFYAAIWRLFSPTPIATTQMMFIAVAGLIVNLITAFILKDATHDDINVRSAFLHMLGDTASSVGVIVVGFLIQRTGKSWLDPIGSMLIATMIGIWSVTLIKDSVHILLEATPKHLSGQDIANILKKEVPDVIDVNHIHAWDLTSGISSFTAHIIVADIPISQTEQVRNRVNQVLCERFRIRHTNLQFECQR